MPMYHPSVAEMGKEGQVLDLETAVKDGVLDDVTVNNGSPTMSTTTTTTSPGGVAEKLDLKKMMEELEKIEVPNVFICPISLEAMQDPVTLCTGQTYERSNITKWLSLGHVTCPTTMQELWDDSMTPNKTLQQLIFTWFCQKYLVMKKRSEDVQGRVLEILEGLKKVKGQFRVGLLKELRVVVGNHSSAKNTMVDNSGVALISSLLGPFTSHAVGSEVVGILVNLSLDFESKLNLTQPVKISLMVDMLNEGSIETKVNCTRLILGLMERRDFEPELISSLSLLVGLLRLIKDKRNTNGVQPGLSLLKMISSHESLCISIVSIGGIPQLVDILPSLNPECLELALGILENLSGVEEGRIALKNFPNTITKLVKLLMRVSESCTQLALSILWVVCKLAPDECAPIAVEAGLAAKLLLVIQSGCNPTLKQQSVALLKLCSLNYTTTNFISKCKLTRTLQ